MMQEPPPLMLCMEKADGEEVSVQINPGDDFHCFLRKAKTLLGYDVDIASVTRNQPVALTDNIYQFLLKHEKGLASEICSALLPSGNNEDYYVLDDGTQIRASQIHFDNEDTPVDLTAEEIPFVKYCDVEDDTQYDNNDVFENKLYNIAASPVRFPKENGTLVIPFKLINNYNAQPSGFEAQFHKYLEMKSKTYATLNTVTNRNKSPRSLIRDNFKKYDENFRRNSDDFTHYTREDILNMFKDSPVPSLPYENPGFTEKRRHVRKSDPSRLVHKSFNRPISYIDVDGVLISESESQNCVICAKYVESNLDKLYIFDNEDQRLHSDGTKPRKSSTQLKIICAQCLEENFRPCRNKSPNKFLSSDEYLVIRNGQQYVFQKINPINVNQNNIEKSARKTDAKPNEKNEYVKVEIGSDGEIVTRPIKENDDIIVVKDERKESSSDVEIIENEPDFDEIDNLDDADDEVIEFLGKYQCESDDIKELKCRFCKKVFKEISEVIDHGDEHKHDMEDGAVYPCPLCDYGYANFKWLKGHLKAAHDKNTHIKVENKDETEKPNDEENKDKETSEKALSPVSSRTRNSTKNSATDSSKEPGKPEDTAPENNGEPKMVIKTEVKQETIESSDDEIWIVQTADDDAERQLNLILNAAKKDGTDHPNCDVCGQVVENQNTHKCLRRGRKRRSSKDDNVICVPTKEDFYKRAQGRIRNQDDSGDDLLVVKSRKKKNKEPSSDPQIVTCHNCNESFTSKVRLKFHMQFHDTTNMLTPDGEFTCVECDDATFQSETALFDHVHFQHNKQRRWQCPVTGCGKTFYLRATLTKHSRTHTDTRRYVCGTCGKRFLDKQTLDEHGVTHLQIKPFQCHICMKQLTRRSRLRMHLRAHEEELCPRLVLVCAVCSRAFRDANDVQEHITRFPECIDEFASELKQEESVTVQLSPTSGLVRQTVQIVESPKLSKPISRQAVGAEAEEVLRGVPDSARPIIRCVQIEKAFRCEFCEDVFYSESGLNSHRSIHKGVKNPFTCHICKVSFATYSRCTTHKTTHGFYKRPLADVKKQQDTGPSTSKQDTGPSSTGILGYGDFPVVKHFLCEDCGRSYLHWTYLQVHRRMKHAGENCLYKCEHCEMSFPNSWSLSYHRKKMHTKADQEDSSKPKEDYRILCRDCDEVLPNKTALYKHRKKQHSDPTLQVSNENPVTSDAANIRHQAGTTTNMQNSEDHDATEVQFLCQVCKKGFPTRSELTMHAEAHAPNATTQQGARVHACGWCSRPFRTQSMLAEHARTHTGERPFPCDVCGVAFRRSTAMRNHRLIHSGVRAWACVRCPKRFRIRSDLRTHLRLKHPARLVVIEVPGLNPSPEEVMEKLSANNIAHDKVIEITKMSFPKGTSSIIPHTGVALDMLGHVPRTQVACSRSRAPFETFQPARRGRGIAKAIRKPKMLMPNMHNTLQDNGVTYVTVPTSQMQTTQSQRMPFTTNANNISYPVAINISRKVPLGQQNKELSSLLQSSSTSNTAFPVAININRQTLSTNQDISSALQQHSQNATSNNTMYPIAININRAALVQHNQEASAHQSQTQTSTSSTFPVAINITRQQDIPEVNVQLLIQNGGMGNGNQMGQPLDDSMLLG